MSIADTVSETVSNIPEWSLSSLKAGNDAVLAAAKRVIEALDPVTSLIPSVPLADKLPEPPQPTELLSQWFSFIEKVVAEQKRFGLDLAGTVEAGTAVPPASAKRKATPAKPA